MQNPGQHIARLIEARDHDPSGVLGAHPTADGWSLRTWQPGARDVRLALAGGPIVAACVHPAGLFEVRIAARPESPWQWLVDGVLAHDAHAFPPTATPDALYLFGEGRNLHSERLLGARCEARDGVFGVCFRVWAPGAERVSVVGDFNRWDGRRHPMQSLGASGVWELFVPSLQAGALYKFELRQRHSGAVFLRADPYARRSELRPATASVVCPETSHAWQDAAWLAQRARLDWRRAPFNCYELHAGSWQRHADGGFLQWHELAERLIPYVKSLGCTHVELLPLTEHPLDESWGYQSTGFFAPSARFGDPDGLRAFVDACHAAGLGCVLDWVPGHFPVDDGALAHFDGSPLYEHADPRLQRHPDWGTSSFNYARHEVRSFLLSSARYWLDEFHFDGLRVDAVASMLYLDYSRRDGEWAPNRHGGRENLEAIEFLQSLNTMVATDFPGVMTIAEESTAWPRVTHSVADGGLGFSLKWNMGWMNDSLRYFALDPIHRRYHHALLTFGQLYAYSECFVLPLSHDEVVHGKGSLVGKMPGDDWQRFANLRLLLAWQMTSPGKKLNFMGNEFGQSREWASQRELEWAESLAPAHAGVRRLLSDLGRLYRDLPALHALDHAPEGFCWLDCNDAAQSTLSYLRQGAAGECVVVALNFTPVPRAGFRVGVPRSGQWQVVLNSDSRHYGGADWGEERVEAVDLPCHGQVFSLVITLPPLAALVLAPG